MSELSAICFLLVAFLDGLAGPLLWPAPVHYAAAAVVLAHAAIAPFIEAHQSAVGFRRNPPATAGSKQV